MIGKWLSMNPQVLLLDEPTRGVDIGAKQEIYRLMEELAERGVAILFVSSEMEEVLSMSDRVIVMHEGRITGELTRDQLSEEAIMQLATGNPLASNPGLTLVMKKDPWHIWSAAIHLRGNGADERSVLDRIQHRKPDPAKRSVRDPVDRRGLRDHHCGHRLVDRVGRLFGWMLDALDAGQA